MRFWYLSQCQSTKARASQSKSTDLQVPLLLSHAQCMAVDENPDQI